MKKNRLLVLVLAIGMVLGAGASSFAGSAIEKVQAYINHDMSFEFNGTKAELPDGYSTLVYEGRSYVPVRFIAEQLGIDVDWNDTTKVISINSQEDGKDPGEEPNNSDNQDKNDYKALPLYKENLDSKVSAILFSRDEYGYKLHLTVENKTDTPIQLDQMNTVVVADGKEHKMSDASITQLDTRWYNDIRKDEKTEGYVRLPNTVIDPEKLHIEFSFVAQGSAGSKHEPVSFDIAL